MLLNFERSHSYNSFIDLNYLFISFRGFYFVCKKSILFVDLISRFLVDSLAFTFSKISPHKIVLNNKKEETNNANKV